MQPIQSGFGGFYYDGRTPVRTPVVIVFTESDLRIAIPDQDAMLWPLAELTLAGGGAFGEPLRLSRTGARAGECVAVPAADFPEELRRHAPALFDQLPPPVEGRRNVLASCVGVAAAAGLLYLGCVRWAAESAATYAPVSVEQRLGQSAASILAPQVQRCADPVREQQIGEIVDRLSEAAASNYRFQIIYVNDPKINAFAAPGGYIIVFDGLLRRTETPEEFAGVLAHEIEHVLRRHSTKALARELSGRTLFSLMAVDVSTGTPAAVEAGAALEHLQHRRTDEEEADRRSVPLLAKARIDASGLTRFLRRLHVASGGVEAPTYFSSHPSTLERAARLEQAARKVSEPMEPLMSIPEWEDARAVCSGQ